MSPIDDNLTGSEDAGSEQSRTRGESSSPSTPSAPASTLARLTGSADDPVSDGGVRGVIFGALSALLAFANGKTDALSDADVIILAPVVIGLAFLLAGIWDRYIKPRL